MQPQIGRKSFFDYRFGAFVYRLVLKIFILARGVRLPYALQQLIIRHRAVMLTVVAMSLKARQGSCSNVRPIANINPPQTRVSKAQFIKKEMANHKSCEKRIRQTKAATLHNHYYAKTMRNAVRKLRAMKNKEEAVKLYPAVQTMLDKLAKNNIIHKNKAANIKSSLMQHIAQL